MMEKVSVLMAVHNGEKYLRMAVDSMLVQTFSDFEFIIVNDGSQDGSSQILAEYSDPRIVLLENQTSVGLTKSLNLGLEKASGEYIARMDADDVSLRHRLATQVSFLDVNPEVGVVGTAAYLINSENSRGQIVKYPEHHDALCWIMCFFENPIIHPSVMFRTQLVKDLGGYDDAFVTSQDYDLWSRAVIKTKVANIQEVCLGLRKHEGNISQLRYHQQQQASLEISVLAISRALKVSVEPAQLQSYCDFLWNKAQISGNDMLSTAEIIYRLAKIFLNNPELCNSDRLWIVHDGIKRLNKFQRKLNLPLKVRMNLFYWVRSLKHLA